MKKHLMYVFGLLLVLSSFSFAQLSIVIDGENTNGEYTGTCPSTGHIVIPPEAFIAGNGPMPDNANDLSSKVWVAWDENYFYYYEERLDDELVVANIDTWYQQDCSELKIDPNPLSTGPGAGGIVSARMSVLGADLATPGALVDNINGENSLTDFTPVENEDYARTLLEDPGTGNLIGVTLEMRIPWASMIVNGSEMVNVVENGQFGLAINISDNDTPGAELREGTLQWSAGMADAVWNTPRLLGTAVLRADNQIELTPWSTRNDTLKNDNGNLWYKADPSCADFQAPPVFNTVEPAPTPFTASPTPTAIESDVISVFSGAYTDIAGSNFNPDWGQSTLVSFVPFGGDTAMVYSELNYQGLDLGSTQDLTAAGMQYLHIDFYNATSNDLGVFLISSGPVETRYDLVPPGALEQWTSVDIPLSEFAPVDLADVFQFKFEGNGTVYLDNIYFSATKRPAPTNRAARPSNPEGNVISIFSDVYTNISDVDFNPNWGQRTVVSEFSLQGDTVLAYSDLNYQGIDFSSNHQDVSGMSVIHFSLWNATSTALNLSLISPGPAETPVAIDVSTTEEWVSVNVPLSSYSSVVDLSDVFQLKFDGNGLFYVDNLVFATEDVVVGIEEVTGAVPSAYTLEQNYPNPFNPETTIRFSLKQSDVVSLTVYNTVGQQVARLITNQRQPAGVYEVTWDGKDDSGNQVASGVYLYRISSASFTDTKKMVLMK